MFVLHWLKKPYFFINSFKFNFIICLGVGFFIFLFLFIFRPFGITSILNNKLLYTAGFGLITFICSSFFFLLFPILFQSFFDDENWTVAKNILFLFLLVFFISVGNYYYNSLVQNTQNIDLLSLKDFLGFTFTIAIFPIIIFTYVSEKMYRYHREKTAKKIMNIKLSKKVDSKDIDTNEIIIFGENNKENISFNVNDLIYITSQGNYASFYLKTEKQTKERIIRSTLFNIQKCLNNYSNFVRCHKSYIINTKFINSVSGNARGYYLKSDSINKKIPVSRNFKKDELTNLIS